jgi:hypothetical protein
MVHPFDSIRPCASYYFSISIPFLGLVDLLFRSDGALGCFFCGESVQVLQNDIDLLNPPAELEKLKHKKKRLVQSPNSFFMVCVFTPLSSLSA